MSDVSKTALSVFDDERIDERRFRRRNIAIALSIGLFSFLWLLVALVILPGVLHLTGDKEDTVEIIGAFALAIGSVICFYPLLQKFTRREYDLLQAERRSMELYRHHSEVLEQLAAGHDLGSTLSTLARALETHSPEMKVAILSVDDESRLQHLAAPSLDPELVKFVNGRQIGPNAGPCGTAAYTMKPIISTDLLAESRWPRYTPVATKSGMRACWSTPIVGDSGKTIGTVALYYTTPRGPLPAEKDLVDTAVHTARIAIQYEKAKADLIQREQQYLDLLENAPFGIFKSSYKQNRFLYANPALAKILDYQSAAELLQIHLSSGFWPDATVREERYASWRNKHPEEQEAWVKNKDGKPIYIRAKLRILQDDDIDTVLEGIIEDITQKREMERRLAQTEQLAALGQLAGGIAHDFNNALMIIDTYLDLAQLASPQYSSTLDSYFEKIKDASTRSSRLTAQLLAFSRRQVTRRSPLSLNTFIADGIGGWQTTLGESIRLRIDLRDHVPLCILDPIQMEQVFLNLLLNAKDSMPDGGEINIHTTSCNFENDTVIGHTEVTKGSYVKVTIQDDGRGITSEDLPHLFEPFFTTKDTGKGMGLGLASVYGIVNQSKGFIGVESQLGVGTTFSMYFPSMSEAATVTEAITGSVQNVSSLSILLVEDNVPLLSALRDFLQSRKFQVTTAESGETALEAASSKKFDLLISDIVMPGISGPELRNRLLQINPDMKTILMSGYNAGTKVPDGVPYLQKPFKLVDLSKAIESVI